MPKTTIPIDRHLALKKKKTAKITALSVLAVVLLLAVLIIVAACIPMNLKPRFISNPDRVVIYNASSTHGEFASDQEKYAKFMEQFDKMFEASYLVSLFAGRLGDYQITNETDQLKLSDIKSNTLAKGYYVEFKYDEPQLLTHKDGTPYKSQYRSEFNITFTSLFFAISDHNSLSSLDIYVAFKYAENVNDTYVVKITQKANTYNLYTNLSDYETF